MESLAAEAPAVLEAINTTHAGGRARVWEVAGAGARHRDVRRILESGGRMVPGSGGAPGAERLSPTR